MGVEHYLQVLLLIGPIIVSGSCTGPTKGFASTIINLTTSVGTCTINGIDGATQLRGYAAGACNSQQSVLAALSSAEMGAYAAVCFCKKAFYDNARTLSDVTAWGTCVLPPYAVLSVASKASSEYILANLDAVYAPCNVCTDAQFPPIGETLEQVEAVLNFVLDWRGELLNLEVDLLKESLAGLVTAAIFNGSAPNGNPSPTAQFIISTITKGSPPSSTGSSRRDLNAIEARQSSADGTSTNNTDPAYQPVNEILEMQVRLYMVPANVTSTVLSDQLKTKLQDKAFLDKVKSLKANITSTSLNVVRGLQTGQSNGSATASDQGTSTTTAGGASASATKSIATTLGHSLTSVAGLALLTFGLSSFL